MSTEGSPIMGHPVQGSSAVIGPDGRVLTTTTTANEELIIFDLDMEQVVKAKTFADAGGHVTFFLNLVLNLELTATQIADPICFGLVQIRVRKRLFE